ncbi:response regulator transcription factor [Pseudoteredinibacter isoporae]|uniref:DNA-binding response OmpR family regulator n=1 Tax=Pseudoteredinibacter isoporae TaxID=570281 RepID=A0A7X0JU11_9GAMM|nr:response regulator transcription factor [Pseudoteredinibacter isoporae]MBB6521425.1 DNA-binding response OmpR family regulator [Pseudoteredinibacter isoporae]NHO86980.1 response regulator transcription factor [Pseudoteredinibacter isoporae]NIB24567.1 response regulator transcription factor [Pseudoteredinibacter isoporae]
MAKLLLVDDDQELCALLGEFLSTEGFETTMVHDGQAALDATAEGTFDLIVLDVMLPIYTGFEVLRKLRDYCQTPVLMLTAKGEDVDRIVGLEMGADDYLPKPCNPRELVARIRAILRRVDQTQPEQPSDHLVVDQLELQISAHSASYSNKPLTLTGAEFTVLELLMRSSGQVISKEALTEQALGRKLTPYDRSIDVHVSNLRKKLAEKGASKELIINIRGAGYMLTVSGKLNNA